jgi:hypothetical protein
MLIPTPREFWKDFEKDNQEGLSKIENNGTKEPGDELFHLQL